MQAAGGQELRAARGHGAGRSELQGPGTVWGGYGRTVTVGWTRYGYTLCKCHLGLGTVGGIR